MIWQASPESDEDLIVSSMETSTGVRNRSAFSSMEAGARWQNPEMNFSVSPFSMSVFQYFSISVFQYFSVSALQCFSPSVFAPVRVSACQHFSVSVFPFVLSAFQDFSVSAFQFVRPLGSTSDLTDGKFLGKVTL